VHGKFLEILDLGDHISILFLPAHQVNFRPDQDHFYFDRFLFVAAKACFLRNGELQAIFTEKMNNGLV